MAENRSGITFVYERQSFKIDSYRRFVMPETKMADCAGQTRTDSETLIQMGLACVTTVVSVVSVWSAAKRQSEGSLAAIELTRDNAHGTARQTACSRPRRAQYLLSSTRSSTACPVGNTFIERLRPLCLSWDPSWGLRCVARRDALTRTRGRVSPRDPHP
jgi:hypothetical protein